MQVQEIELKKIYTLKGGKLKCITMENPWDVGHENWQRPAVIVVPGGGYALCSRREAVPVASRFFAKGFQTFVLEYLCRPQGAAYPEQLLELACAVDYVRKNAKRFHVNAEEIFVIGFSAGGHLTANLAVEHHQICKKFNMNVDSTPKAVALCYPVISNKFAYKGTHENLLFPYSETEKTDLLKTLNVDESVSSQTPPSFIWTTVEDDVVPPENALAFAMALQKHKISYELHVYPNGAHGTSTCGWEVNEKANNLEKASAWVDECIAFFRSYCQEKF